MQLWRSKNLLFLRHFSLITKRHCFVLLKLPFFHILHSSFSFSIFLMDLLYSQRGYQTYKAKYPWGKKRFESGCYPSALSFCFKSLKLSWRTFSNCRCFCPTWPKPSQELPFPCFQISCCKAWHKSWEVLTSGGPRHYDPDVYNQQREQLMAILPQSQKELPPRRWENKCAKMMYEKSNLSVWSGWIMWSISFSGWSTVMTLPSSHLAVMLCWEIGPNKTPMQTFSINTNLKQFRTKSLTNLYNNCTCNFMFRYLNPQGGVRIGRLLEDMDVFAVHLVFKHVLNPRQVTAYALQSAL